MNILDLIKDNEALNNMAEGVKLGVMAKLLEEAGLTEIRFTGKDLEERVIKGTKAVADIEVQGKDLIIKLSNRAELARKMEEGEL